MNDILTFAVVTAILKNTLENALVQQAMTTGVGDASVTTLPPDRIVIGADEHPQINLYLYRLTPDTSWRQTAQQEPTLALKLHYLLSVYSERDFQAEILLGMAVQCLQTCARIPNASIRAALGSLGAREAEHAALNALARSAASTGLDEIRVTPEFLSAEEHTKLWGAFQAHARLSVAYQVAVVLNTAHERDAEDLARVTR